MGMAKGLELVAVCFKVHNVTLTASLHQLGGQDCRGHTYRKRKKYLLIFVENSIETTTLINNGRIRLRKTIFSANDELIESFKACQEMSIIKLNHLRSIVDPQTTTTDTILKKVCGD